MFFSPLDATLRRFSRYFMLAILQSLTFIQPLITTLMLAAPRCQLRLRWHALHYATISMALRYVIR